MDYKKAMFIASSTSLVILGLIAVHVIADSPISPFTQYGEPFDTSKCSLSKSLLAEIQSYQKTANDIFQAATQTTFKGKSYAKLKYISDKFGPRPNGSPSLEKAQDYLLKEFRAQGLVNVLEEKVQVPHPLKSKSIAYMVKPRIQKLAIQCTGYSASTLGLFGEVFMIPSAEFFRSNKEKVRGKIAMFDYRVTEFAPDIWRMAEKAGAVAILTRSLSTLSIYTIAVRAGASNLRIPTGILTNEDVDLFHRLSSHGKSIELYLKIINEVVNSTSRNIMADLPGKAKPDEFVLHTGHTDTWVLQGAQDDGIGIALALYVPKLLKTLNLIPKRTVRSVLWTGDEMGIIGTIEYVKTHYKELSRYSAVLESDGGCFKPLGYFFQKKSPALFGQMGCILNEIMKLQKNTIGAKFLNVAVTTSDIFAGIDAFSKLGIPAAMMNGDDDLERYFWYHHTKADTMSIVSSDQLDRCLAFVATTIFILADITDMVPRT